VADSLVGVTFVRNLLATALVFAVTPWTAAVGLSNMFLTIGIFMAVTLVPGTIAFIYYGKRMRARTANKYCHYSALQAEARAM
jgi:hypothetical protein